jgi:hypothetical protein
MHLAWSSAIVGIGDSAQQRKWRLHQPRRQRYNAGSVDVAASLVTDDIIGSDCDYREVRVVVFNGRSAFVAWLKERAADHDHLELGSISDPNRAGGAVLPATFAIRASDTLRSLGFASGIHPQLVAKVIFTDDRSRIRAFGNGPSGGDQDLCRPR